LNVESYLELKVLELLRFKVRGSAASTLAKRLRTSEEELSYILESMVDNGKLMRKGRYYRLPTVVREITVELPAAPCHRILMKFSGLRVSWAAVERLRTVIKNVGESIAREAGNNARSGKRLTVSAGDVDAAASKLGLRG
jgi:histone H3/H4